MTTNEINTKRLDLHNGEKATLLVAATRWRLLAQEQQRQRIVAISQRFVVTAPVAPPASDPAIEKWIADGAPTCGSRWTGNYSNVEPAENRPGYIGD